jgi:hypothetical protein
VRPSSRQLRQQFGRPTAPTTSASVPHVGVRLIRPRPGRKVAECAQGDEDDADPRPAARWTLLDSPSGGGIIAGMVGGCLDRGLIAMSVIQRPRPTRPRVRLAGSIYSREGNLAQLPCTPSARYMRGIACTTSACAAQPGSAGSGRFRKRAYKVECKIRSLQEFGQNEPLARLCGLAHRQTL